MNNFQSILHAIANHAKTIPDKIAIIEAETDRKCTYSELWAYIKAFSKRLISAGVKKDFGDGYGTRVVVCCTQTIEYLITGFAIQLAGGVFIPVEKNIADNRVFEIMKETDSKIYIAMKPIFISDNVFIKITDATLEKEMTEENDIEYSTPDTLVEIMFTTGTTGESKGVMLSQRASTTRILSTFSAFNHNENQVWLIPSPLSHVNGLRKAYISIFYQCTVVLLDGYMFAKSFFLAIKKYRVTILNLVSASTEIYLQKYSDNLKEVNNQIKYISLAGSSFSKSLITSLKNIFTNSKIIELYGSTEVGGCYIDHSKNDYASFCIGYSRYDTNVVFFNEQKNNIIETNKNNPGFFAMNSDVKMLGYWKNPELTASVTRDDYIVLSDLGYKGDDGLYYFLSRADDIIISGGYKIAPLEIEAAANSFMGIRESACIPVSDPIMGYVPKLFIVMEENFLFDKNEIHKYLSAKLETTKLPRFIEEINEIPKINNKINRRELKNTGNQK